MKLFFTFFLLFSISLTTIKAQVGPTLQWQKCLGGSDSDYGEFVQLTSDGGYLVTGSSKSVNGNVSGNHGAYDFWVARLDGAGNIQWQKSYGGSGTDLARSIIQLSDGSFLIAGYETSADGDVAFNHGNYDMWLIKIDAAGNLLWEHTYGGSNEDDCFDVISTADHGFILTGAAFSLDGDITNPHGGVDAWLVKVDSLGMLQWQKTFGGSSDDYFYHTLQTDDGGFITTGFTSSANGDVSTQIGITDVWVVKTDDSGNIQWEKTYGGTQDDRSYSISKLPGGKFVVAGKTASNDNNVIGNHGGYDLWAFEIDDTGNLLWQKCVGGTNTEYAWDVSATSENGCIISGETFSNNGDIASYHANGDAWLIRLDSSGNVLWNETFGGNQEEWARRVFQDNNGYFIGMCRTLTQNNGDVTGGHGSDEYWLINVNPECSDYPLPDFTYSQNGLTFNFSDASQNATAVSWNFGDGSTSTDLNPVHSYAVAGLYTVCLTATGTCTLDSVCKTITTCGSLQSNFGFEANGLTVQFSDSSIGALNWFWKFGDGATSASQNPVHTYSSIGSYDVCLNVADSCTASHYCQAITVCVPLISANFSYVQSGISFQFTDQSGPADGWLWDFGNGVTSTEQNPNYYYAAAGNYNVCLIASELCDADTFCQQVTAFETDPVDECWANLYDNLTAANDMANVITVDTLGNSYVAGTAGEQLTVLKYDPLGNLLWTSIYDSAMYQPLVRDMVIDKNGNNFIAVSMSQVIANIDWLILKYDQQGNLIWQSWYSSAAINSQDVVKAIALDDSGNVYAAGNNSAQDFFLLRYDDNGAIIWQKSYDYDGRPDDLTDLKVDHAGNIYITGEGTDVTGSSSDAVLIKYNEQGVQQWLRTASFDVWNRPKEILLDYNEDVMVGTMANDGGLNDLAGVHLNKYSSAGTALWSRSIESYLGSDLYIASHAGLGVDSSNQVYWNVYLNYEDDLNAHDINVTYKYSPTGTPLWNKSYTSALNTFYDAKKMVTDQAGNSYLTGSTFTNFFNAYSDSSRIETVKLNSEGEPVWIRLFNNPLGDVPISLTLDQHKHVFVTGYSKTLSGNQFITIKYCPTCMLDVSLSLPQDTFCTSTSPVSLTGGFPPGGAYNGDGVSNNSFDPTAAGPGPHIIYYTFSDTAGCVATASETVFVDVCTEAEYDSPDLKPEVFPNPLSETATIQFRLPENSVVSIVLVDLTGKKIETIAASNFSTGNHQLNFSGKDLPKGIYFIHFKTDFDTYTQKLIVQ